MLEYILKNFLLIYLLEVGAAIAGSIYLKKVENVRWEKRLFVYYLWFVVFVEAVGLYPAYNYFTDNTAYPFLVGTVFERNYWWYNAYHIVKFTVLFLYFIRQLKREKIRKICYFVAGITVLSFVVFHIFSGGYFKAYSAYDSIVGTLLLMLLILFYYYELLRSDKILTFYKSISFYISIGLLVWHLVITPLFIYSNYFSMLSPYFVELHEQVLQGANIFMYGIFIFGFLFCSRQKVPVAETA